MASLSTILSNKNLKYTPVAETNLLPGNQFIFIASHNNCGINQFTWTAPSNGTVTMEIWGASGSTGRMCCCGGGIPANSGAYSKKTIPVTTGNTICGTVGRPCYNQTLCYPGRSENTCICYVAGTSGTVCAEGGYGGFSVCNNASASLYCQFISCNFCFTNCGSLGCGWICNFGGPNSVVAAVATGGDINCSGGISCICFSICDANNSCYHHPWPALSNGVFSTGKSRPVVSGNHNNTMGANSGMLYEYLAALNYMGHPIIGRQFHMCTNNHATCTCYEISKCMINLPYGVPAIGPFPCNEFRDNGMRGGPGAVRIEFIGS